MARVKVNTGPIDATDYASRVPRESWRDLVRARCRFLQVKLPYDCRELLRFIDEGAGMLEALGYADLPDFIRRGLELDPALATWAVEGLRSLKPNEPVPFKTAVDVGRTLATIKERNRDAALVKHGKPARLYYNLAERQNGTSTSYLLARLDRDHPDLAARVRTGELKPYTAAREAGIVKVPTILQQLLKLWAKATPADRAAFLAEVA